MPLDPDVEGRKWHPDVITGRRRDTALLPSLSQPIIRHECEENLVVMAIEAFTQPALQQDALARIAIQLKASYTAYSWPLTKLLTTTQPGGYALKPPDNALRFSRSEILFVNVVHHTQDILSLPEPVELSVVLQVYRRDEQQKGGD